MSKEERAEEERGDAMRALENRTIESKQEMVRSKRVWVHLSTTGYLGPPLPSLRAYFFRFFALKPARIGWLAGHPGSAR